jgi:predicted nucleic acid-binding protein
VKLLVLEDGSDEVGALVSEAALVGSSRISFVECHAALARTRREGRIGRADMATARRRFDERWSGLVIVELDEPLGQSAAQLCHDHPLRSADAIHLASAAQLAETEPDVRFASWDRRLWEAAGVVGLTRVPESFS